MQPIKRTRHDSYPYISARGRREGAAKNKSVLITGGGKSIGKAIAIESALAGASKITLAGRDSNALKSTAEFLFADHPTIRVFPVSTDLTSADAADFLISTSLSNDCLPDILINNAGTASSTSFIADTDPSVWWPDFTLNLHAPYLLTRAWLRALNGRPGTVINVSSSVSDLVAPNMSSYGTSKMALNRLTECIQLEYGSQGVRALAFHPGGIASTGMGMNAPEQYRARLIDTVELAARTALLAQYGGGAILGRKRDIVEKNLLVSRIDYGDGLSAEVLGLPDS